MPAGKHSKDFRSGELSLVRWVYLLPQLIETIYMQTQQLLIPRTIFLAGGTLYLALLAAWAPWGILTDIFLAFQSSSGFPEACSVA